MIFGFSFSSSALSDPRLFLSIWILALALAATAFSGRAT